MDILESTRIFEQWLADSVPVVDEHLGVKHNAMKDSPFAFLRGTYYHWTVEIQEIPAGRHVPSTGDMHIENFGTWRDAEGRLVWGINDYDEAATLPWQNDLLRLLASALLALDEDCLDLKPASIVDSVLSGYVKGLTRGPRIYTLAERNDWLREIVKAQTKHPDDFFAKLMDNPRVEPPQEVKTILLSSLPADAEEPAFVLREAGMGSLGKARYAAIVTWNGGLIAREARAVCPPSQNAFGASAQSLAEKIVLQRKSSPDPFRKLEGGWLVRRLAPDCTKVETELLEKSGDQVKLLSAMGREIAAVHLCESTDAETGALAGSEILREMESLSAGWFRETAQGLADKTRRAYKTWRKHGPEGRDSVD